MSSSKSRYDQYIENRLNNFNNMKEKGIDVFPYVYDRTHKSSDVHEKAKDLENDNFSDEVASVAGRVLTVRNLGKIAFLDLHDINGKVQIVLRPEELENNSKIVFENLDDGDVIGVKGKIFKTKRGEPSISCETLTLLSKCFLPLPEKYHGIVDPEIKYRKRHLDLMVSKETRDVFIKRAKIIDIVREILKEKGFLEVETPLLQPLYGGANARPFVTESFVWKRNLYLSISPELYLKRLLVGGLEKVFTISKNFRNEGVDRKHNPEFTMIEMYECYKDYNTAMDLIEEICETIALRLNNSTEVSYEGKVFDFKRPWARLTMKEAITKFANINVDDLSDEELRDLLDKENIKLDVFKRGLAIEALFEHFCESELMGPIHIIDHPKETTPLCKLHREDKDLIERNEPYVNATELANMYSELNDPFLQEELMKEQLDQGRSKGETHPLDHDFIECLKYGMPPAYGVGIGIDRLVMIFTDSSSIRDVILFPLQKEEGI